MSDPIPTPEPPVEEPAPTPRRRINWCRLRTYFWATSLVLAIDIYASARMMREHPKWLAEKLLAQLPFPASVGSARWMDERTLEFRDVKMGDFFYADSITISASLVHLMRHHFTEVDIVGPQVFTKRLNEMLAQGGPNAKATDLDWSIAKLTIRRGTLMLDDLASGMPSIPVRMGVTAPIILNDIQLGHPNASPSMTREQKVDIQNVNIVSPFDPLAPVLSFPLTHVRFTYTELWHHQIREVDVTRPVLHLGQDLFWFSDEFKKEHNAAPATGVESPWRVGHFKVRYGQLAVNVFGQPAVQFPFFFDTDVDNIRLDQLDKISAKSVVAIRRLDQEYPDYKIKIVNLSGRLDFSIPPTDTKANNVVPTVHIDELAWNGIAATNVWSSVTFDPNGIYGKLGGDCETGYLKGNFEVYYTKGFLWNGDFFAEKVDCKPIAQKLAGKYFSLTGAVDGKIAVQGKATEIQACKGELDMVHPGLLEINSVEDLMKRLPGDAQSLKNQAMKIGLEAFRVYPYQTGALNLDYTPAGGSALLKLEGPRGKREFSVFLHPFPETSKIANAEENR